MAGEVVAYVIRHPNVNNGRWEAVDQRLEPESAAVGWREEPLVLHSDYAALVRERDEAVAEVVRWKGSAAFLNGGLADHLSAMESDRDRLREALEAVMPYVATTAVGCHGDKCREPWCYSCFGEEEAEVEAKAGLAAFNKARAALAGRGS